MCHLASPETEMIKVITEFSEIFSDVSGRAKGMLHNVDVVNAEPIKQNLYRVNPRKLEFLRKEVGYMLEHGITEPSQSNWRTPYLLVPKGDGSYRFCTDGSEERRTLSLLYRLQEGEFSHKVRLVPNSQG